MHKHLCHWCTAYIHILNLLWCDVLPLSQLEDVLLSVNNLENSTLPQTKNRPDQRWEHDLNCCVSLHLIKIMVNIWESIVPELQVNIFKWKSCWFLGKSSLKTNNAPKATACRKNKKPILFTSTSKVKELVCC